MELPRYQSRALPELTTLSPQMAAAEAGAMSQALASGLDVVSQVTARIQSAEAEAAAEAALAETSRRVDEFAADQRWTMTEIDGEPADQVLEREWKKLSTELLATTPVIRDRAAKQAYDLRRKDLLSTAGIEIAGQQRSLQVERGKALTDFTADRHAQRGDFTAAQAAYDRGVESGLYSTSEYLKRSQDLQILEVEDGYLRRASPTATDQSLVTALTEVNADGRLPPAKRRAIQSTISSEIERRDRSDAKRIEHRQRDVAVAFWQNLDSVTLTDISTADLRQEDKVALSKAWQSQNREGIDDPGAVAEITRLMMGLGDGSATREDVQHAITRNVDAGRLSPQGGIQRQQELMSVENSFWSDREFWETVRQAQAEINKGTPSEQLSSVFKGKELEQRAALATEIAKLMMDRKRAAGLGFDPGKAINEIMPDIRERSKSILTATDPLFNQYRVLDSRGNIDEGATKKRLDEAFEIDEIDVRFLNDAYAEFGIVGR